MRVGSPDETHRRIRNQYCLTPSHCLINALDASSEDPPVEFQVPVANNRGGFRGGGSRGSGPPLSYMKNDVMHTVIYAAFCMLPSLDLQDFTSF